MFEELNLPPLSFAQMNTEYLTQNTAFSGNSEDLLYNVNYISGHTVKTLSHTAEHLLPSEGQVMEEKIE